MKTVDVTTDSTLVIEKPINLEAGDGTKSRVTVQLMVIYKLCECVGNNIIWLT